MPSDTDKQTPAKGSSTSWNDPKVRTIVFQVVAAGALVAFFYYILQNTLHNMESRGIKTGFAFLTDQAGFGILMHLVDYDESFTYGRVLLVGLLNTLLVSVLGIFFATLIGFTMGVARLSSNWLVSKAAMVYIEALRNVPLLLQIFFWYSLVLTILPGPRESLSLGTSIFFNNRGLYLPSPVFETSFVWVIVAVVFAIGASVFHARRAHRIQDESGRQVPVLLPLLGLLIGLPLVVFLITGMPVSLEYPALTGFNFQGGTTIIPELIALLWALSTYTATFIAEIVRAGILSVTHGQTEAASALGLRRSKVLNLVVIPQAMRVIIPPLSSQYLNLMKNSSLATAIGYPDLVNVFMGTSLNQTGQAVEIVGVTMAVYLIISLSISTLMNWYNRRMALSER